MFWFATQYFIQQPVRSAMEIVHARGFRTAAFPIIGSCTGMCLKNKVMILMLEAFDQIKSNAVVCIVRFSFCE